MVGRDALTKKGLKCPSGLCGRRRGMASARRRDATSARQGRLRRAHGALATTPEGSDALTKKGLKLEIVGVLEGGLFRRKRCPDEEGIETAPRLPSKRWTRWRRKRCPDEEGIETTGCSSVG